MCGLFTAINFSGSFEPKEIEIFKSLTNLVSYRGPDFENFSCLNVKQINYDDSNVDVFLGHRRLSIIDLSAKGNQPMEIGDLQIIHNGEIFNYIELKELLIKKGVSFFSDTDTEVILKSYQKYGSKSFSNFNGMWAFIIVDSKNKKIVVSRDRFSIKPLYYLKSKGKLFFASEIKQLIPLLENKELNEFAMFQFLQQGITDQNENTFFNSIHKVKPKTNLIINLVSGEIVEEQYWDYESVDIHSNQHAIDSFKNLLIDSIRIRLRSDVNVGALLSGGLDSSAISVLADSLIPNKFTTFSIVSDDPNYSEEYYVDQLVDKSHISNQKISFDANDVLSEIGDVIYHQDEPFGSFSIVAQNLIFKKIKTQTDLTVVLSGQGGDEVLLGYLKFFFFYLKNLLRKGRVDLFAIEFFSSLIKRTILTQFVISSAKRYMPSYQKNNVDYLTISGNLENIWEFTSLSERQKIDIDSYSVPNLARYEDRNSMAYSLETRTPFLDHRLVNLLLSLKENLKIKNGWTKYILRKALDELPDSIRWRRDKKNFIIPEVSWLKSELKQEIFSLFNSSKLSKMGVIKDQKFLSYYGSFLEGNKMIHHADISRVYIAEKWARQNF